MVGTPTAPRDGYTDAPVGGDGGYMGRRNRSRRRRGGPGGNRPNDQQQTSDIGISLSELSAKSRDELVDLARAAGLTGITASKKDELARRVFQANAEQQGHQIASGILEIIDDGYGFLRKDGLRPSPGDVYVSPSQIRRFGLRTGDMVMGQVRPPKEGEKYFGLLRVETANGVDPDATRVRPLFENLTPLFPDKMIKLETSPKNLSNRLMDMVAPVGRGQRGLIVSPPKAGKTLLLKSIANGIAENSPDIVLMVVLVGERPEEVTDMVRSIKGEVYSSTFDEPVEDHTRVAELALERAKRLVECGKDVVILLDSLTRLTRAYNLAVPSSGRTLSGGIDPVALYPPKRFFGAARNTEQGGSLTILATCLIDTGSRMDEVIYEEFKGTGNLELHLDRKLAERRVFPAMDIPRSGTRREELLLDEKTLKQVWLLRRILNVISSDQSSNSTEAIEKVMDRLSKTANNAEFLASLNRAGAV